MSVSGITHGDAQCSWKASTTPTGLWPEPDTTLCIALCVALKVILMYVIDYA